MLSLTGLIVWSALHTGKLAGILTKWCTCAVLGKLLQAGSIKVTHGAGITYLPLAASSIVSACLLFLNSSTGQHLHSVSGALGVISTLTGRICGLTGCMSAATPTCAQAL